jgi:hypothetical protein
MSDGQEDDLEKELEQLLLDEHDTALPEAPEAEAEPEDKPDPEPEAEPEAEAEPEDGAEYAEEPPQDTDWQPPTTTDILGRMSPWQTVASPAPRPSFSAVAPRPTPPSVSRSSLSSVSEEVAIRGQAEQDEPLVDERDVMFDTSGSRKELLAKIRYVGSLSRGTRINSE